MKKTVLSSAVCLGSLTALAAAQQPFVRIQGSQTRALAGATAIVPTGTGGPLAATASVCSESGLAYHSQLVPGGGSLNPVAFANPATIGAPGQIFFSSNVDFVARNQGVFRATSGGLSAVVTGCGGGGGSGNPGTNVGDPSPIGGKFTGFFGGTPFAPGTNLNGDVTFVADVFGGSAPRGLFLYRASTNTILKIAAVGDVSPTGATLTEIGPGSINSAGVVVFLASRTSSSDNEILKWQSGVLTKIAAVGDAAPSGGNYQYVGGESFGFVDGTNIPTGPIPDINDVGTICFHGYTFGGTSGLVVVPTAGAPVWYVRDGDAAPSGGTYQGIWAGVLNNVGQVAFYTDVNLGGGNYTGGWFVGSPSTSWRKAVTFYDAIHGGWCNGLAVSRNPMQPLSDDGDLTFWANSMYPDTSEREWLVVSHADGSLETVAGKGEPTSLGGVVGTMDAWPSKNNADECTLNCATPGGPGFSAHFLDQVCRHIVTYCSAGTSANGCNALMTSSGLPSASAASGFNISVIGVDGQRAGIVFYGVSGRFIQPWATGSTSFLCLKTPTQRTGVQNSGGTTGACDGVIALDWNAYRAGNPGALGAPFATGQTLESQAWFRDPPAPKTTNLSNALEFTLTP
jgi:hypothetical protein